MSTCGPNCSCGAWWTKTEKKKPPVRTVPWINKRPSKYEPHQGAQEKLRRLKYLNEQTIPTGNKSIRQKS